MAPSACVCFIDVLLVLCLLLMFLPVADTFLQTPVIEPTFPHGKLGKGTHHSAHSSLNFLTKSVAKTSAVPSVRPMHTSVPSTNGSSKVYPSMSTHISATFHPMPSSVTPPHSTVPTPPYCPTVQPCPMCQCADDYKSKMWVATSFAIVLGIVNAILIFVMVRQQRIYRDIEGDPALSRLI